MSGAHEITRASAGGVARLRIRPPQAARVAQFRRCATSPFMKTFTMLLLACASVFGAESDIRIYSTTGTNAEMAIAYTKDAFTRDGETNLIRIIKTGPSGVLRIHRFYHAGQVVGNFVAFAQESTFNTEATPYCMSLKYGPSGEIRSATIGDREGVLLDEFAYTNGVFSPVERAVIERENAKGEHMKPMFGSDRPQSDKER
jgi:hypothetical protein